MTVGYIKPNADHTNNWVHNGSGNYYEDVDEYPDASDAYYVYCTDAQGDGSTEIFRFSTLAVSVVTQVKVYTIGSCSQGNNDPSIDVSFDDGSSWEGAQTCNVDLAETEATNTWGGLSKSQTQLNNFVVKYTANVSGKGYSNNVYKIWVEVTYTLISWNHDMMGVSNANIVSINGFLLSKITNVKGVAQS